MNPAKHLMRTHGLVMLLCIAGGVTACVPVAEQPAPTIEADVAAISRVIDEGATALNLHRQFVPAHYNSLSRTTPQNCGNTAQQVSSGFICNL